jgi:TRAP-type uncharacterized transport system substrate-binding protein
MKEAEKAARAAHIRKLVIAISLVVVALVLFVTLVIIKPAMPDRIELLTGPEGSPYHSHGQRLATELQNRGLETTVIATDGAFDNIRRLATSDSSTVAFAPSSVDRDDITEIDASRLVSLGAVGYEPLWLFYRTDLVIHRIPDLAGLVIATGVRGSVSEFVARGLLERNGIQDEVEIREMDEGLEAALRDETVDAGFVTGSTGAPLIHRLLQDDDLAFLSFERADAYSLLMPGITTLKAPEGIFDLERNVPRQDSLLLSATTTLVALDDIPAAVAPMVLDAAADIQAEENLFSPITDFPSRKDLGLPLERSARRYFEQGKTGLSRFLPYDTARWLNHLGFVVLPFVGVVVVLIKFLPMVLKTWGQIRLVGLLKKLEAVEKADAGGGDRSRLLADLDQIDKTSAKMFVPRSTVHDYIDFRQFLHDMRERIESRRGD